MKIDFECKKCQKEFDCEIGKIGIANNRMQAIQKGPRTCLSERLIRGVITNKN